MATPQRMCRVCRKRKPQAELVRWVVEAGQLVPSVKSSRGYYTDTPECAQKLPLVLKGVVKG